MAAAEVSGGKPRKPIKFLGDIRAAVTEFGGIFPPRKVEPPIALSPRARRRQPEFVPVGTIDDYVARFVEDVDSVRVDGTIRIFESEADPQVWNHPLISEALDRAKKPYEAMIQHAARAQTMMLQGRYEDALYDFEYFRQITTKHGLTPEIIQATQPDQERQTLQEVFGGTFNNFGWTLMQVGQYEDALTLLHQTLQYNPNQIFTNNNLADCFRTLGHPEMARAHYQKELEINPTHPTAQQSLTSLE